jgi:putative transposase
MQNYRKTSHVVYDIKYHIVWSTKYRKKVLYGQIAERLRDLIREICKKHDIDIIKGSISKDHAHLFISVPHFLSVSKLTQSLKGKTSYKLLSECKELSRSFWGRHIRGRGYFAASSGNVTDEVIMEYIATQDLETSNDDFNITSDEESALADVASRSTAFEPTGFSRWWFTCYI